MKNWKTTTAGVLAIIIAAATAGHAYLTTGNVPDLGALVATVVAATVGIFAKDNTARL